jgi:NAD(P)-dependent dehydrogenase (short-subunit alcohol dehydrogenase family)
MTKKVLLVGSSGGIGTACAEWFKARGYTLYTLDRDCGQDATNPEDYKKVLAGVEHLDVLVNAAGSVGVGGIEDCTVAEWRRVLDDNLTSAFVACQVAFPLLRRDGSIVLFSSVNGRHGGNRLSGPAYAAAKAAIIGLTKHLAKDLAHRGIRVNAIAPGPVATPMLARLSEQEIARLRATMPLGNIIAATEIAGTVGWLCSPDAKSITGMVIDINGGMWMA